MSDNRLCPMMFGTPAQDAGSCSDCECLKEKCAWWVTCGDTYPFNFERPGCAIAISTITAVRVAR